MSTAPDPSEIIVYAYHTRSRDGAQFLIPVGRGVRQENGDLHVELDALPTNGKLLVRVKERA